MAENALSDLMNGHGQWPWEQKARDELNEDPDEIHGKLDSLKEKIKEYCRKHADFKPQMDDTFLSAFLRSRKYKVDRAFKSFIGFYKIRTWNTKTIFPPGKGPLDYRIVWERSMVPILNRRNPFDGTIVIIWSYRTIDLEVVDLIDILNSTFLTLKVMIAHPSVQTFGFRFLYDMTGVTFAVMRHVLARLYFVRALLESQGTYPTRFKGLHVVNEPFGIAKKLYYIFKPLMSAKMNSRLHFHGSGIGELHSYISPSILPEEFGGTAGPIDGTWILQPLEAFQDEIVRTSYYGYSTKD